MHTICGFVSNVDIPVDRAFFWLSKY